MSFTSDFKPFATGTNALVLTPQQLVSETWLANGFPVGIADPASCNTLWRQSSFVCACITQWMANILKQNIHDDGNLTNFISLFGAAIAGGAIGGVTSFNTRTGAVTLLSSDVTNALGYTPVQSFNGRTGAVTLTASDVDTALGYVPVNKAGDTMTNPLNGPAPTAPSNYATKAYVDSSASGLTNLSAANGVSIVGGIIELSQIPNDTVLGNVSGVTNFPVPINPTQLASLIGIGLGGVTGSGTEVDFPLPGGGVIKVGSIVSPGTSYTYTFVTPFQHTIAFVGIQIINPFGTQGMASSNVVSSYSTQGFTWAMAGSSVGPQGFTYMAIGF